MLVDVILTPCEDADFTSKSTVIIDVLRASTTILTALQEGATTVKLVVSVEEALAIREKDPGLILGGEREGIPPAGFDLGNSPLEYTQKAIGNREIILTTTNGTRAANKARESQQIYIGCIRNIEAISNKLAVEGNDVILYCAGNDGRFSFDDALCAGLIIQKAIQHRPDIELSDSASFVMQVLKDTEFTSTEIVEFMLNTFHGRRLSNLGFEQDITFCSQLSTVKLVPYLMAGKFII